MARGFPFIDLERMDIIRDVQICSIFISEDYFKVENIKKRRELLKEYRERFIDG